VRRDHTGVCIRTRMRAHLCSPSYLPLSAKAHHCQPSSNTPTDKPHHYQRRAPPQTNRMG